MHTFSPISNLSCSPVVLLSRELVQLARVSPLPLPHHRNFAKSSLALIAFSCRDARMHSSDVVQKPPQNNDPNIRTRLTVNRKLKRIPCQKKEIDHFQNKKRLSKKIPIKKRRLFRKRSSYL